MPVHTYYVDVSLPRLYGGTFAKFVSCRRYVNKNVLGISVGCISLPRISKGKYREICLNCARKIAEFFEKSFK